MADYDAFFQTGVTKPGRWLTSVANRKKLTMLGKHYHLDRAPVVVEIGPGKGLFAAELLDLMAADYVAVEGNPGGARALSQMGLSSVCSMVPPLPLRDCCADIIHADQVLEHMPDRASAVSFLAEARRVLRPGGLLSLAVPDVMACGMLFFFDYTHNMPFTPHALRWLVRDAGFDLLECRLYCGPFFGIGRPFAEMMFRLFPWGTLAKLQSGYADEGPVFKAQLMLIRRIYVIAAKPEVVRTAED